MVGAGDDDPPDGFLMCGLVNVESHFHIGQLSIKVLDRVRLVCCPGKAQMDNGIGAAEVVAVTVPIALHQVGNLNAFHVVSVAVSGSHVQQSQVVPLAKGG